MIFVKIIFLTLVDCGWDERPSYDEVLQYIRAGYEIGIGPRFRIRSEFDQFSEFRQIPIPISYPASERGWRLTGATQSASDPVATGKSVPHSAFRRMLLISNATEQHVPQFANSVVGLAFNLC